MAKGYGIIFIILSHLQTDNFGYFLNSFHVPLFFFLSGFVFSARKDFKEFFIEKCKSLLFPYLYLGVPMMLFHTALSTYYDRSFLTTQKITDMMLNYVLQERMWTIWFLTCLFLLELIFYFLVKKIKSTSVIGIISALMAIAGLVYYRFIGKELPWNVDICFTAIPFFYVGYLCKCNKEKFEKMFFTKRRNCALLFIFTVICIVSFYINSRLTSEHFNIFHSTYGNPLITYIGAFAGIFAVVIFSQLFTLKFIRFIGINSILYFGLHQTIFIPCTRFVLSAVHLDKLPESPSGNIIFVIIQFVLIITALTILQIIIDKIKSHNKKTSAV